MFKWIRRILVGLLSFALILVILLAGFILYDAQFGQTATAHTNMTFTDAEGHTLIGYLAQPDTPGPHPAVLLIHEWWGLNEGIPPLADALAEEGYVVLAADAYRGNLTSSIPRAIWLVLTTPEERIFADLDAALAHLRGLESVDPEHGLLLWRRPFPTARHAPIPKPRTHHHVLRCSCHRARFAPPAHRR